MSNAWQIHQTRLAALLPKQPIPAPSWLPGRRVARVRCEPIPGAGGGHGPSVSQLVRLPGIWRPDGAPLPVRAR